MMDVIERILNRDDPRIVGVILSGSRARGMATEWSDYDVTTVLTEQDRPSRHDTRTSELDEVTCTVEALADTSVRWPRYGFRGAQVLIDRLGGRIAELVDRQATPTTEEAVTWAREALDGYLNQLYRAAKSRREGAVDAARLDEMESVPWLLETVFALHGRLRPYNKYLLWELDTHPLPDDWNAALKPERLAAGSLGLFPAVESLARARGHAGVVDSWGADVELIRAMT